MSVQPETKPTPAIDPTVIAQTVVPFVRSVKALFNTMVGLPTTVGKTRVKETAATSYDVTSVIGFSGEVIGTVIVSFQKDAALKLVAAFAGAELAIDDPDFADAVGELANMIAGGAKKDLGVKANITCPTVIIGTGHIIARLSDVPCLVVPCSTSAGDFAVEINIKQLQAAAVAA